MRILENNIRDSQRLNPSESQESDVQRYLHYLRHVEGIVHAFHERVPGSTALGAVEVMHLFNGQSNGHDFIVVAFRDFYEEVVDGAGDDNPAARHQCDLLQRFLFEELTDAEHRELAELWAQIDARKSRDT